jgi:hypothetical protein
MKSIREKPLRYMVFLCVGIFVLTMASSVAFAETLVLGGIPTEGSLKDYTRMEFLETDPNFDVILYDINSTSVQLLVKSKITGIDVPVRELKFNQEKYEKELEKKNVKLWHDIKKEKTHKFTTNGYELITMEWSYGELIQIGWNSTVINLVQGYGNLGDAWVKTDLPDTNFNDNDIGLSDSHCRRSIIQWNLSNITSGSIIDSAKLAIYFYDATDATSETFGAFEMYCDGCFGETNLTWNTWPSANMLNASSEDTITLTNSYGWYVFDIPNMVANNIGDILTIALYGTSESCGGNDYKMSRARDYGTAEFRPMLNVTYSEAPMSISIDSPTNTTYGDSFNISVDVTVTKADDCWWNLDGGTNVTGCINSTVLVDNGLHYIYAVASNSTTNLTSAVNFTVNIPNLRIRVYDEDNLTALDDINVTLYNGADTANFTNIDTYATPYNITTAVIGSVTVSLRKDGYSDRDYLIALTATDTYSLAGYMTKAYDTIVFVTQSTDGNAIAGVDYDVQRQLNSTYTTVASGQTDIAGGVTLYLSDDAPHTFTFSKSGYSTNSFSWTPDQSRSPYYIQMNRTIAIDYNTTWDNINYWFQPVSGALMVNQTVDFQFHLTSSDYNLSWYAMNVSYQNGTQIYFINTTDTYGGTLNYTITVTTSDSNITVYGMWQKLGYPGTVILQQNYSVFYIEPSGYTLIDVLTAFSDESHGINKESGLFIYIIMLAIAMSGAGIVTGVNGAGAVGITLLIIPMVTGLMNPLLGSVIILTIGAIMYLQRG